MTKSGLIVGDIGGTNARFAVYTADGELGALKVLPVGGYQRFDEALAAFLDGLDVPRPDAICVATAGAQRGDVFALTNAPWTLGQRALRESFGFSEVRLFNDFQAQARFAGVMPPTAYHGIHEGEAVAGTPVLTIGPGTGFGQSLFVPGQPPSIVATEGGHRRLIVTNAREFRLYERLEEKLGWPPILEDALSGRGLVNLFDQISLDRGETPLPVEPKDVTASARDEGSAGHEAVLWFLDLLAIAAADACLSTGARGGVAISGGIISRLTDYLDEARFAKLFARRGNLADYLDRVPLRIVTEPMAALYGAGLLMRDQS
jgi:glucokinase